MGVVIAVQWLLRLMAVYLIVQGVMVGALAWNPDALGGRLERLWEALHPLTWGPRDEVLQKARELRRLTRSRGVYSAVVSVGLGVYLVWQMGSIH